MKNRILIMFGLMLLAVGTLYALNATSTVPNRVKNGFNRKFLSIESSIVHRLEFDTPVRELAGQYGDSLFLMTGEPGKVYVTDLLLSNPQVILLEDPKIKKIVPRFYSTVIYPNIYILGGNATAYVQGNIKNGKTEKMSFNLKGPFDNPIVLDSFIIARIMNTNTLDSRFHKLDLNGKILAMEDNISQGKADGGMKYSCLLKFDAQMQLFVNLHYYDNGFEVFDNNLRLFHRSHTIDTVYNNPSQIFNKDGALGYKHPPVAINGYAATFNGKLYVRSKLIADNENKRDFYSNSVIDRYNIESGKYEGSFYLPIVYDEPVRQFYLISENQIVALTGKTVLIYSLNNVNSLTKRST